MLTRGFGVAAVLLLSASLAWAGGDCVWQEFDLMPRPATNARAAGAFHPPTQRFVLFGGQAAPNNHTWLFDGEGWTELAIPGPPNRQFGHMVYDSARQNVVLYGGVSLGDTWTWDGATWTERLVPGPAARVRAGIAFDAARGEVVLFGGAVSGVGNVNETWVWNGAAWTQRFPATSPPVRQGAAMAYDAKLGRVVLYGGVVTGVGIQSDTWLWDGENWAQLITPTNAGLQFNHVMSYDPDQETTLLIGSNDLTNVTMWRFEHGNWSQHPVTVPSSILSSPMPVMYNTVSGYHLQFAQNSSSLLRTFVLDLRPVLAAAGPLSQVKQSGDAVQFEFTWGAGEKPTGFQWEHNGVALVDGPTVSGATGPTLTITDLAPSDTGVYSVRVWGPCDERVFTAVLTVLCPGDANGDGMSNFADLNLTVSNFNTSCPQP